MNIYYEDSWNREKDFSALEPKEEKLLNELRSALHRRDFESAKKTLRENFQVEAVA